MRSNYKRIGDYIRLIDERNNDLSVSTLLGLSINKIFIPSVANTVGTNMANYKVIKRGQFACSLMQVRRDGKMPVALLKDYDEAIISQAYPVFEIVDNEKLLPEYLMMWMTRTEFDRHACFLAVGGVRGSLEWEDFCDMELPIPLPEKQREIIREYHTVTDRIKLGVQLNQKLEETAQAIYRQWFVEFEFPISAEYAASIGKPELEGKLYKSSGGEMEWCEELEREIPKGWTVTTLGSIAVQKKKSFKASNNFAPTAYIGLEHMPKKSISLASWENVSAIESNKHMFKKGDILFGKLRPYFHKVGIAFVDGICSTDIIVMNTKDEQYFGFLLSTVSSDHFVQFANSGWSGTKMPRTNWEHMADYSLVLPRGQELRDFAEMMQKVVTGLENKSFMNRELVNLQETLLSKMATIKG